jgi:mono/diheme cytochrome c family protein
MSAHPPHSQTGDHRAAATPGQTAAAAPDTLKIHAIHQRENPEPEENQTPLPPWLLAFIAVMLLGATIYAINNRGGLEITLNKAALIYDERYTSAMDAAGGPPKPMHDPLVQGKKLFAGICATCHQATGQGIPGVYPPLVKSEWANGPEERVIRILLHGLGGPLTVEGRNYDGSMPSFGKGGGYNWSDENIASVLTYIRQEWGNTGSPVDPVKVTEIRTKSAAGRAKPWTQPELEAIP